MEKGGFVAGGRLCAVGAPAGHIHVQEGRAAMCAVVGPIDLFCGMHFDM